MVALRSLGVSKPAGLSYLLTEELPQPNTSAYTWSCTGELGDELLVSGPRVTWTRFGAIHRIFTFEVETEKVVQALFADFPQNSDQQGLDEWPDSIDTARTNSRASRTQHSKKTARAVVILLKTQAHIYFIGGSTHVVNLPVEVQRAFSTPYGVILQRELSAKPIAISFQATKTPANSFAPSQPAQIPSPESWRRRTSGLKPDPFYAAFWRHDTTSHRSTHKEAPHHLYLRDPLIEVGIIGEVVEKKSASGKQRAFSQFSRLSPNEEIIYISSSSELSSTEVLIALTWNGDLLQFTIWKIVETSDRVSLKHRRKVDHFLDGRRRSSRGPGTGTTTPGVRASINPRESVGGFNDGRNVIKSRKAQADTELVNQLDAAFEGAIATSQTSRRISSLLARSDLATGNDAAGLTDPMPAATKRGTSFGGPGIRSSIGGPTTSFGRKSGRPSHYGIDLEDVPSGDISDDTMDTDSDNEKFVSAAKLTKSLQQDVAFVKIHAIPCTQDFNHSRRDLSSPKPSVVVLQAPTPQQSLELNVIAIYVHDPNSMKVFCTNMDVIKTQSGSQSKLGSFPHLRVRNTEVFSNVVGVCKVGSLMSASLIMLVKSEKNITSMMKHVPWCEPEILQLPSTLLRRNPFQVSITDALQRTREGSLKRVLSQGIDQFSGLRSSSLPDHFEVADSKGIWHRLELQSEPDNRFVRKLLNLCQSVITGGQNGLQLLIELWNRIRRWHISTYPGSNIDDWRLFLITICSLFVIHLPPTPKSAPARTKRKAGLLRSSSGAQIDTESFDAMILSEDQHGRSTSSWLQDMNWTWATEMDAVISSNKQPKSPIFKKIGIMQDVIQEAKDFLASSEGQTSFDSNGSLTRLGISIERNHSILTWILAALHFAREEEKLNVLNASNVQALTPLLAQIGSWLRCSEWDWREPGYYSTESIDIERWSFDESTIENLQAARPQIPPPSIFAHVEDILNGNISKKFASLSDLPAFDPSTNSKSLMQAFTPRTQIVLKILEMRDKTPAQILSELTTAKWDCNILENLPEGLALSLRSALIACQSSPPASLSRESLRFIGREDLAMLNNDSATERPQIRGSEYVKHEAVRDYHQSANSMPLDSEDIGPYDEAAEIDRSNITRLIFCSDQRFAEAARLVHPLKPSVTECKSEPDWSDQDLLEAQQELAKIVAFRTLSVSPGRAMLFYNARHPLLTEKFPIHGFTLSTIMRPSNITVAADRSAYTEERVSWAFFHAGVEAGLTISRAAKGIDTSWILFNKPKELGDRHAGFLLALGLNGHLKKIAKWVAFKYLTPKHTMTSIGLLLGLAASHIGSMDALITRLLSVHVTRMLPPGAAELNLSPLTQTTGIMALGLLYYHTQHRRMTEVMLSEIECIEQEEGSNPMEDLRDEGYRLAAGFALGYINLGQGRKTKGLHDLKIVERLLTLVAATREISLVHVLDKATAGATIAIALIFLKTGDQALANKIDIPDTLHQFEYVRPDIFLLRTVARHLIMWDKIEPTMHWIKSSLPTIYQKKANLGHIRALHTEDLPLYNILTGICLAIGLRFAGSGRTDIRDLLIVYLDQFIRINNMKALHYDGKLTRVTTRNCQDVVVLAAAAVMAGTGDLHLLRRYRSLHGRTNPETPYGSHLAAHQAIGLLFLGGGTYTLSTSNLAIASLLCSFYPLFPSSVQDNKAHLQAFRHFWVFAADPRCLTIRDTRTLKPLSMNIVVISKTGAQSKLKAPCLLPELDTISKILSDDHRYWPVVYDFTSASKHLASFKQHQSMFVRRKGAHDTQLGVFASAIQTLNDRQVYQQMHGQVFEWVFMLSSIAFLEQSEKAALLPGDADSFLSNAGRITVVDDRLALEKECLASARTERLWSLRLLFKWTEYASRVDNIKPWLDKDVIESFRARIAILQQG